MSQTAKALRGWQLCQSRLALAFMSLDLYQHEGRGLHSTRRHASLFRLTDLVQQRRIYEVMYGYLTMKMKLNNKFILSHCI